MLGPSVALTLPFWEPSAADPVEHFSSARFGKLSPSRVIQHTIHPDWMDILLSRACAAGDQGPNAVDRGRTLGNWNGRNKLCLGLDKNQEDRERESQQWWRGRVNPMIAIIFQSRDQQKGY